MRVILGSAAPLFPSTGYFRSHDEEMTWRESSLSAWNLYFTLDGRGKIDATRRAWHVGAGDLIVLPPRLERTYRVSEPKLGWEFYWLHFRPTAQLRMLSNFERGRVLEYHVPDPGVRLRLAATLEEMNQINLRMAELPHRDRLMELLVESLFLRVAGSQAWPRRAAAGVDPRIAGAIEIIHRRIGAPFSVSELARHAGLSRSQFCLLFRAGMGRSLQVYIEERRLELARFYLTTTAQSVGEIAASVGYPDPFYFTNRFRKRFGVPPRTLRAANLEASSA